MRPQFTLRVRPGVGSFIQNPRNQAEASVKMELTKERNEQIEQAAAKQVACPMASGW